MRKYLFLILAVIPAFGQPTQVQVVDTSYYPIGSPAVGVSCTFKISGPSNAPFAISGVTIFPGTQTVSVINGAISFWITPNYNNGTYAMTGTCVQPYAAPIPTIYLNVPNSSPLTMSDIIVPNPFTPLTAVNINQLVGNCTNAEVPQFSSMTNQFACATIGSATVVNMFGDVIGTSAADSLNAIQGTTISAASPPSGSVLQVVGGIWMPETGPTFPGTVTATGGFSGNLTGNVTGSASELNGTTVPTNSAANQVIVTNASAVAAWITIPQCPDAGIHLNFINTTNGGPQFICGDTGGTAASVSWSGVTAGTNANSLLESGSLAPTGGGTISANLLNGTALSGLATGLLCNATSTGVPFICGPSNVESALGFTPPSVTGTGASGTWGINITGSAGSLSESLVTPGTNTKLTYNPAGQVIAGAQAQFSDIGGTATLAQLPGSGVFSVVAGTGLNGGGSANLGQFLTLNLSVIPIGGGLIQGGSLATCILKNITGANPPACAVDGTDYVSPTTLDNNSLAASLISASVSGNLAVSGTGSFGSAASGPGCPHLNNPNMISTFNVASGGTTYNIGDTGTISGGIAGLLASYKVLTCSSSCPGPVGTVALTFNGNGYSVASGASTTATSGSGTGLTVNITAIAQGDVVICPTFTPIVQTWNMNLTGDVGGYPWSDTLNAIQGVPVSTGTPTSGQTWYLNPTGYLGGPLWALGGLPQLTGVLASAQMPAFTGDVHNTGLSMTVEALYNNPMTSNSPSLGQMLWWNANATPSAAYVFTSAPITTGQVNIWNNTSGAWGIGNLPNLGGTLAAAQEPAHTGDMTNTAGSLVTVVGALGNDAVTVSTGGIFAPTTDSTTAIRYTNQAASHVLLDFDTTNTRVGIGTSSPATTLEVNGSATFDFGISPNPAAGTLTGSPTSGTAFCYTPFNGTGIKETICTLASYVNTGTAQTYTFPSAFTTAPFLAEESGSGSGCGTYEPTTTTSTLTLPANASMTAETCVIDVRGR